MHYSENTLETGHVLYHTRYLTGVKYTVRWKIEQTNEKVYKDKTDCFKVKQL